MSGVYLDQKAPPQNEAGWFSKSNLILAGVSLGLAAITAIACDILMNMNPPCNFEFRSQNGDILEIVLDEGSCAELGKFFNR